ncbi:MAG TPA: putative molybdenum carrier protein [Rhodothermia bacterium]|nr:putative molybdenum carrier protein [Rhodothermia bacterium]
MALVSKVILGGQTGVDRAALELGIEIGGWCSRNRWAEDGVITAKYPLDIRRSTFDVRRSTFDVNRPSASPLRTHPDPPAADRASTRTAGKGKHSRTARAL